MNTATVPQGDLNNHLISQTLELQNKLAGCAKRISHLENALVELLDRVGELEADKQLEFSTAPASFREE